MIVISAAQWGNEIILKYAHKEPTALDLRRMADLLRREAVNCAGEAAIRENIIETAERLKDETLP